MEFIHLFSGTDGRAEEIYQSYCHAFPENERRNEKQFFALFTNPNVKFFIISENEASVGYLITWKLQGFYYIEHFEIFEGFRGKKLGSVVLQEFQKLHPKLILEAEPDTLDEISRRRVKFYERNGFRILDKAYIQPAYDEGKQAMNLFLMGNFQPADTEEIIASIHAVVYGNS